MSAARRTRAQLEAELRIYKAAYESLEEQISLLLIDNGGRLEISVRAFQRQHLFGTVSATTTWDYKNSRLVIAMNPDHT